MFWSRSRQKNIVFLAVFVLFYIRVGCFIQRHHDCINFVSWSPLILRMSWVRRECRGYNDGKNNTTSKKKLKLLNKSHHTRCMRLCNPILMNANQYVPYPQLELKLYRRTIKNLIMAERILCMKIIASQ